MGNVTGYYKVFTTGDHDDAADPEVWPNDAKHVSVSQWLYPYTEDTQARALECARAQAREVSHRLGGVVVSNPVRIKGMSAYAIRVGLERIEA